MLIGTILALLSFTRTMPGSFLTPAAAAIFLKFSLKFRHTDLNHQKKESGNSTLRLSLRSRIATPPPFAFPYFIPFVN
jgi:hypothetical protein